MAYAMADLSWKFYFINAAWNFVFLIIAYFTFVETKGLKLEEIAAKFEGRDYIEGVVIVNSSSHETVAETSKDSGVIQETSKD